MLKKPSIEESVTLNSTGACLGLAITQNFIKVLGVQSKHLNNSIPKISNCENGLQITSEIN